MFENKDIEYLRAKGIDVKAVRQQIEYFINGFPPIKLVAAATAGNGILVLNEKEKGKAIDFYKNSCEDLIIVKFVPASGAASRMFKSLVSFRNMNFSKNEIITELEKDQSFDSAYTFFKNLKKFAFYQDLSALIVKDKKDIDKLIADKEYNLILDYVLTSKGLDYANMPKALIKFHKYEGFNRTSLGEHLSEAAQYGYSSDRVARIHFTVSPEHLPKLRQLVRNVLPYYKDYYKIKYSISFSVQNPSTDTIAVDMYNQPWREEDGSFLFRPGGHGALIDNLQKIKADIIFINNIDNVVTDQKKGDTVRYKKILAGHLLDLQEKAFGFIDALDLGDLTEELIKEIEDFLENEVCYKLPAYLKHYDLVEKADYLFHRLNRPIRVCGMVKNEGEPGGGPFWVKNEDDTIGLQIVESSQIDMNNPKQVAIFNESTHFNPVDLVCSIKDYMGRKFKLNDYINPETGFISKKSKDGKELKALERPGLWNGAMADWLTVFVEVPLTTFNPVKVVNDLLREQHQ